eukprot:TRINITY_DN952_c1_g1_i2.p1 TRINITY_DN952_c1_g1~~TRINITY_DN952_c1_g1_i2.p1  ORF type:complete len:619 (+),score=120.63 TRINITY_DN952_c1_g1_i2:119-1858(+)
MQPQKLDIDSLISRIGFGRFHLKLLFICGAGWFIDAMWLMIVTTTIWQVQQEFGISEDLNGLVPGCFFGGMFVGAYLWGRLSDYWGRKILMGPTLFIAACGGVVAIFSESTFILCVAMIIVGIGSGGNLPVCSSLFIEMCPPKRRGILSMVLSLFFAFGSMFVAFIAWMVIPHHNCVELPTGSECTHDSNKGWRTVMMISTAINFVLCLNHFIAPESLYFLCSKQRYKEAFELFERIKKENKCNDAFLDTISTADGSFYSYESMDSSGNVPSDAVSMPYLEGVDVELLNTGFDNADNGDNDDTDDNRMILGQNIGEDTSIGAVLKSEENLKQNVDSEGTTNSNLKDNGNNNNNNNNTTLRVRRRSMANVLEDPSIAAQAPHFMDFLKGSLLKSSIVLWCVWFCSNFGFVGFNIFVPKYITTALNTTSMSRIYMFNFIYASFGIPGSLLGMVVFDHHLGRRKTLCLSMLCVAFSMLLFHIFEGSYWGVLTSMCSISLFGQLMFAAVFLYTPEVYPTHCRALGMGVASGFNRIAGILAPWLVGFLLAKSDSWPMIVNIISLLLSALCAVLLPMETKGESLK